VCVCVCVCLYHVTGLQDNMAASKSFESVINFKYLLTTVTGKNITIQINSKFNSGNHSTE
jgi:hypothetical protein